MSDVVLDASAVLALLRGEAGAAKVAGAIEGARMCTVNHAEIVSHYAKLGSARDAIGEMLRPLPIALVPADAELATIAGMMRAPTMVPSGAARTSTSARGLPEMVSG